MKRVFVLLSCFFVFVALTAPASAAVVTCNGKRSTHVYTDRNDTVQLGGMSQVISTLRGDDSVRPTGGDDTVCAGPGNDSVNGGHGAGEGRPVVLLGGPGNDQISTGWGFVPAQAKGGLGNDHLWSSEGSTDVVDGEDG